jgi:hypothetical protein
MASNDLPLPPARAVPAGAARMRGVPNDPGVRSSSVSAVPEHHGATVRDIVAADPALEQLRSRKIPRKGLNVHIYSAVHNSFMDFVESYDLPKGDTVSMAMQEFLERRGVRVPGVPRVTQLPAALPADVGDEADGDGAP